MRPSTRYAKGPGGHVAYQVVGQGPVDVIFAPDHARVASELVRVCRPGGRVGLTAWRRDSGIGQMFATWMPFLPTPPPGAGSPFQWGDEEYCRSMLGDAFELSFEELDSRHEGSDPVEMWELYRVNYGPSYTLWNSLDEERRAELDEAMKAYFEGFRDGDRIDVERKYIIVAGIRKG